MFKKGASMALRLYEVTMRDGLQNERAILSVDDKIHLVKSLIATGFDEIELCSFVRPDLVPQMATSKELCERLLNEGIDKSAGIKFSALVPNLKGFESVLKYKSLFHSVVLLTSCTESHSKANVNMSIQEHLKLNEKLVEAAKDEGIFTRAYASLAFGCPFEIKTDPLRVREVVDAYIDLECDQIVLADTYGHVTPKQFEKQIRSIFMRKEEIIPEIGLHLHDAQGHACDVTDVAVKEFGIEKFDGAIGGCGGCNFIEGAKGNISIEALLKYGSKNNATILPAISESLLVGTNQILSEMLDRDLSQE